ncbi:hypothetical protein sos41_21340 [Alphaproteobacteria bacterium SO-S41]|nr:hypothetical protein sos41_21340 [Alphaproteobacteria bacterium SO-S41]
MGSMKSIAFAAALAAFAGGANAEDEHGGPPKIVQMSFLTGNWREVKDGKTTEEHWIGPVGGLMAGTTITYSDGAKTTVELMTIEVRDNTFVFVARLDGQPTTVFTLKEADNGYAMFENPDHDFPQRVIYTFNGEDTLNARIEGTMDGKEAAMEWHYTRIAK